MKTINDIDFTELQDAQLEYLGLTSEDTNVVFNEGKKNMLVASVSKEKGIINNHKSMVISINGQGICDDEFDRMMIDKETLKEIAYTCDYLYTDFGIDVHSHTLKTSEPFKNLKIKRIN